MLLQEIVNPSLEGTTTLSTCPMLVDFRPQVLGSSFWIIINFLMVILSVMQ